MYKVLIVDDDPLELIGLQTLFHQENTQFEITHTANNGKVALEIIDKFKPDLVITDIKMPIIDGINLVNICHQTYGALPVFILLTCYEDFAYAKSAIKLGVADYIIKSDLNFTTLKSSLDIAVIKIEEERLKKPQTLPTKKIYVKSFQDKFFIRLFNNLFDSNEQLNAQLSDNNLSLTYDSYVVAYCKIPLVLSTTNTIEKLTALSYSITNMLNEILSKQIKCYVVPLDLKYFTILFCNDKKNNDNFETEIYNLITNANNIIFNYFNINIYSCIGVLVTNITSIHKSYNSALLMSNNLSDDSIIIFANDYATSINVDLINIVDVHIKELAKSFEELNIDQININLTSILELIKVNSCVQVDYVNICSNILHLVISLLIDGEKLISDIFIKESESYRCLFKYNSKDEYIDWIIKLRDGLSDKLGYNQKSYNQKIVANVQSYICSNIEKKLSLHDVSSVFNFNPNYLSQLFTKYANIGFVEYITQVRIDTAKKLMKTTDLKIYQIAEYTGFENAFYFSKVFKKNVGVTPREYMKNTKK